MELLPGQHWYSASRADPRIRGIMQRHYSARPLRRQDGSLRRAPVVPPGDALVLATTTCDAVFVWHKRYAHQAWDGQMGINCTVFRNESDVRASLLIREAAALAWSRWPGERLFTYVDPGKVQSEVPGYCFRRAGWKRIGTSKGGLLIFEKLPESG